MLRDVEGFDLIILQSKDWNKFIPEYICVETINTTITDFINSDINNYLSSLEYNFISKLFNSVIYKRNEYLT